MARTAESGSGRLADRIARAAGALERADAPSPRREAELLAAHALGVEWSQLWSRLEEEVGDELDDLVRRRLAGEPLGYILGSVSFRGLELVCGPGVLVPRPETEVLVDVVLELAGDQPVVADVGTGTGAIAIAVAAERPGAEVWATDLSQEALDYAARNVAAHRVDVRLRRGDLLDALPPQLRGRLDVIAANPPYIPATELAELPPDVRLEPAQALFGGPSGDDLLNRLIGAAPDWMRPGGVLAVEVGTATQADRMLERVRGWAGAGIRPDLTGRPRIVWARRA